MASEDYSPYPDDRSGIRVVLGSYGYLSGSSGLSIWTDFPCSRCVLHGTNGASLH